jgi:SAM-dependent methyltransferase
MKKFPDKEAYQRWVDTENWYQTIELPSGVRTQGKFQTDQRCPLLAQVAFQDKRVLDIGCNSGQYSLFAKARGAREVIGIDLDEHRLYQAQMLALNEELDVTFRKQNLLETEDLGVFDIVLCFAVLTEIEDFFGAIKALKKLIGGQALTEIGLAHGGWFPFNPRAWMKLIKHRKWPWQEFAEIQHTRTGLWIIRPNLSVLKEAFGSEFKVEYKGPGLRYDSIEIRRLTQ